MKESKALPFKFYLIVELKKESLQLKKKKEKLNGFHKSLEGLISVFFDYPMIKYYNIIL